MSSGQPFGVVESSKAVSDLYAPVSGEIVESNESITESPEGLNDDMYDDGWMVRIKISDASDLDALLSKEAYEAFFVEEAQ